MKKLFLLYLLFLPTYAAADLLAHQCEGWEPTTICGADGGLLPSYELERNYNGWVHIETVKYQTETIDDIIQYGIFYFKNILNPDLGYDTSECSNYCPLVTECDFGQLPGQDEICTDYDFGPYICGLWSGSEACDPVTGDLSETFRLEMYDEGWIPEHEPLIFTGPQNELFINRYAEYKFKNNLGAYMVFDCDQHCPLDPNGECTPDKPAVDEFGICTDEPVAPEEATKLLPDLTLHATPSLAAANAGEHIRDIGVPYFDYGAIVYYHPGLGLYRYTELIQEIGGDVRLEDITAAVYWSNTAGFDPVGYVQVHSQLSPLSTEPTTADYDRAQLILDQLSVYGVNSFWVYTGQNTLVSHTATPPVVICNPYRGCPDDPDPVEPPPEEEPPPVEEPPVEEECTNPNPYRCP
jgi:hypothetical protein